MTTRRLAAIMVADVVGYSKLVGSDEAGTLSRLSNLRQQVIEPAIAVHAGRLFKSVGDGFLVEFASAVQAVSAANAIQQRNAHGALQLRIGIHIGDVVVQGDDLMGDGVNIAARIEGVAEPGGIAISREVHAQVRDKLDLSFVDLGEVELKNIARPVQVFAIGGSSSSSAEVAPVLPDKPSIAVLPFQNMSGDAEQEYFADGMTEDILTSLARFQNVFVIARNTSFTYKGRAVDVKVAGRELGVGYILEGSIRVAGSRVRITAQLIDTATAHHVWAERYDRALVDIFEVQDDVTARIVSAIDFEVRSAESQRPPGPTSGGLAAWAKYHKAFPRLFRLTPDENAVATAELAALTCELPQFAAGHAAYGYARISEVIYGWAADRKESTLAGLSACRRAVEQDDKDAFCHLALGRALLVGGERDLGLASLDRAVVRNPNSALSHLFRGMALISLDRHAEALDSVELAIRLSPRDPGIWSFHLWRATCYAAIGDFEAALQSSRQTVRERADLWITHMTLAITLVRADRDDEGKVALARALELHPGLTREEYSTLNALFLSPSRLDELEKAAIRLGLPSRS